MVLKLAHLLNKQFRLLNISDLCHRMCINSGIASTALDQHSNLYLYIDCKNWKLHNSDNCYYSYNMRQYWHRSIARLCTNKSTWWVEYRWIVSLTFLIITADKIPSGYCYSSSHTLNLVWSSHIYEFIRIALTITCIAFKFIFNLIYEDSRVDHIR